MIHQNTCFILHEIHLLCIINMIDPSANIIAHSETNMYIEAINQYQTD